MQPHHHYNSYNVFLTLSNSPFSGSFLPHNFSPDHGIGRVCQTIESSTVRVLRNRCIKFMRISSLHFISHIIIKSSEWNLLPMHADDLMSESLYQL